MRSICLVLATLAIFAISLPATSSPAHAKVCKGSLVAATSYPFRLRSAAYAASLVAWRKRARTRYNRSFQNWSRANNRTITCKRKDTANGRRWQCTRIGRPCTGFGKTVPLPKCGRGKVTTIGAPRKTLGSARQVGRVKWRNTAASRFGTDYRRWSKAKAKKRSCFKTKNGKFWKCRYSGRACRI